MKATIKTIINHLALHCLRSSRSLLLQLDQTSRTRIPDTSLPTKIWRPALAALHLVHAFRSLLNNNVNLRRTAKEDFQAAGVRSPNNFSMINCVPSNVKNLRYHSPTRNREIFHFEDVVRTSMRFLT